MRRLRDANICAVYILGHVGLTAAAAHALDRRLDARLPMLLAILPDLVDKPLAILPVTHHGTRSFAHSALGAGAVLGLLLARRRPRTALLLWGCYAGHLLLDRMWTDRNLMILFWPLLGGFPPRDPEAPGTPHLLAYNVAGEALGLALLLVLARRYRLFEPRRLGAFARSGRLGRRR